jgi:putative restriction endonuclease
MAETAAKYGIEWSREELILALYYYYQIPFAKTKDNNPEVLKRANIIKRSPSSLARKLGNFGAFDPVLAKKDITGLTHYSKADKSIQTPHRFFPRPDFLMWHFRNVFIQ